MGDLTRNFDRSEFACKCGCGFNKIDLTLVGALQVFRDVINARIIVTSGCRCEAHNADPNVKGAERSWHLFGKAVDFTCDSDIDLKVIADLLEEWGGGFHYYITKKAIHIDNGYFSRWEG